MGMRLETAARLVRLGFAPVVLISGAPAAYGANEADLAIPYIVRQGYPQSGSSPCAIKPCPPARSASCCCRIAPARVRSVILVTSDFHTARAARIFRAAERALGCRLEMRVVPAPDRYFHAGSWWRNREGRKTALNEWEKTIANAVGI